MNYKPKFALLNLILICIGLSMNQNSFAKPSDYLPLLENTIHKQPQQLLLQGLKELHSAQRKVSNSWLAGDVELQVQHENDALIDNEQLRNWQLGMEFPVWLPNQKMAQRQLSISYAEQLPVQQSYYKWLASAKLRGLVWDYHIAQIEADAAQNALDTSRELQLKVRKKVAAGESPQIDQLFADKEVLNRNNELIEKQSRLVVVKQQFFIWTENKSLPQDIWETARQGKNIQQHPLIRRLISQHHLSESKLNQLKSFKQDSPRVFLGAKNDQDRNNNSSAVIFQVSIPLGINPTFSTKVAQQQQSIYESQNQIEQTLLDLEQQIFQVRQTMQAAASKIQFSKQQFDISRKALNMSEQAYQIGESNIQNLLQVQQQTLTAKLNYQLAKAKQGRAIAQFNQVSGYMLGEQ